MTKTHRFVAAFMLFSALIVTGACDMQNSPYRHTGPGEQEAGDSNDSDNHGGGRQAASTTSTRESQSQSQASSGETNPGETQAGPNGTTDTGANTGIGAFSG